MVDFPASELTSEADQFLKVNTLQGFPLLGLPAGMELLPISGCEIAGTQIEALSLDCPHVTSRDHRGMICRDLVGLGEGKGTHQSLAKNLEGSHPPSGPLKEVARLWLKHPAP